VDHMPIFRARAGASWTMRAAAQAVAVLLLALMPLAPPGEMRPAAEPAASAAGPDHAGPAHESKRADQRASGLTQVAEVGARPSPAKAPGSLPPLPAISDWAALDVPQANQASAAIVAEQQPTGSLPPPFRGRAPPLT
jgi:hypothetical protein